MSSEVLQPGARTPCGSSGNSGVAVQMLHEQHPNPPMPADHRGVRTILVRGGTPQHTPYPAKGPVLPRGPGRSPGRKFWPLNVIYTQKTRAPLTYSTLLESSRRDLRDSGHTRGCEMGQKDGPGRAGTGSVSKR